MKKTIRVIIEAEYETDTDYYEGERTPLEMAEVDLKNDPGAFLAEAKSFEIVKAEFNPL